MAETVARMAIDRPAAEVWAVLADFDEISSWAPNVDHSCLTTSVASGVGATRRIQSGRNTVLETVIEWEPERGLAYSITGLPPVIRSVTNTWRLDDLGGTTEVTLTSEVDAGPRPPQHVVARIVGRVLAKASQQMLTGLEHHVRQKADRNDREASS